MNKTNKTIFFLAWENARTAARVHGGKPSEYFAECLRLAHRGISVATSAPAKTAETFDLVSSIGAFFVASILLMTAIGANHPAVWLTLGLWSIVGFVIGAAMGIDYYRAQKHDKEMLKLFNAIHILVRK